MATGTGLERKRWERGIILRLVIEDDSEWTHVKMLYKMMDRRGYPCTLRNLEFNLKYLAAQGYLNVKRLRDMEYILGEDEVLAPDDIVFVQLAPLGLQIMNRAIKDSEVSV